MTFIPAARIERAAAELTRQHQLLPGFDVERLLDELGLGLVWEPIEDEGGRVLGQLIPQDQVVVLNERHIDLLEQKEGRLRRYTIGHEVGHWTLHADAIRSGTLSLFDGSRVWCRDGSSDPVERQAEMFSAALLMPHDQLFDAVPSAPWQGWSAVYRLADRFVVNPTPMIIRLEALGWAHRDENGRPSSGPAVSHGQDSLF